MGILPKSIRHLHWASLNRIQKSGLKLIKKTCVFGATKIIFLGQEISGKGISPDSWKIKTIKCMLFRKSNQDFLSMIAYISKFIPQLSEQTHHQLRELVRKNSIWDFKPIWWTEINDYWEHFSEISWPKATCDTFKFRICTTLKQKHESDWHPLAFKLRSCSSAEQNYCLLETETSAIAFAYSKCNEYLYGKKILNTLIHKTPPTIQQFHVSRKIRL